MGKEHAQPGIFDLLGYICHGCLCIPPPSSLFPPSFVPLSSLFPSFLSRKETLGFQFWRTGYWKEHLQGKPYHISALYVVDLVRFRRMAVGDALRSIYDNLSRDPNSLANLDQVRRRERRRERDVEREEERKEEEERERKKKREKKKKEREKKRERRRDKKDKNRHAYCVLCAVCGLLCTVYYC